MFGTDRSFVRSSRGRVAPRCAPPIGAGRAVYDLYVLLDRGRPSNQEALREIAACVSENIELRLRLHAFGGDRKLEPARQSDDAAQDRLRLCAVEVGNEAAVDLDHVEGER